LLRNTIYRAFPELDQFSDDQCARFVRAANSSWMRRVGRWAAVFFATIVMLAITLTPTIFVCAAIETTAAFNEFVGILLSIIVFAVGAGAGLVPGLIVRDMILRRRVRELIRRCGSCPDCRYPLLGMRVGEGLKVICPECGRVVEVDPALGDLSIDETGTSVYKPLVSRDDATTIARRRKRRRRFLKWSAISTSSFLALLGAAYGVWWWVLVDQARTAAAERNTRERMAALRSALWSGGAGADSEQEWCTFLDLVRMAKGYEWNPDRDVKYVGADGRAVRFDAGVLMPGTTAAGWDKRNGEGTYEPTRRLAMDVLAEMKRDGATERLRGILALRTPMREPDTDWKKPFIGVIIDGVAEARSLARINGARMTLALEAGDRREYVEAMEVALAAARIVARQGLLIEQLVGYAIEGLVVGRVQADRERYPDEAWTAAVLEAMLRHADRPSMAQILEIEGVAVLDTVQFFFSNPAMVRKAQLGLGAPDPFGFGVNTGARFTAPGMFGTYAGNAAAARKFYEVNVAFCRQHAWQRTAPAPAATGYVLLDQLIPALSRASACELNSLYDYRRCLFGLAVDRHKWATGVYPSTLDEVGAYMQNPKLLIDPISGVPFRFGMVEPEGKGEAKFMVIGGDADEPTKPTPPSSPTPPPARAVPKPAPKGATKR
jgi:hypothetical protein